MFKWMKNERKENGEKIDFHCLIKQKLRGKKIRENYEFDL